MRLCLFKSCDNKKIIFVLVTFVSEVFHNAAFQQHRLLMRKKCGCLKQNSDIIINITDTTILLIIIFITDII